MNSSTIKILYNRFFSLGSNSILNKNELKKVKLFNAFCLVWYILALLALVEDIVYNERLTKEAIITTTLMTVIMTVTQYIHFKRKYKIAHILYLASVLSLTFYFSNYLAPAQLIEYYYVLVPLLGLVFVNNQLFNICLLVLSYLLFVIPNFYFKHYPLDTLTDISTLFLFIGVFVILNYFKTLNFKNESALESKKDELEKFNKYQSQFFINISHEIRTPLTLIKGQIEELKNFYNSEPQLRKIEQDLSHQVNEIKSMVDDVLDSAKMKSADFKLVRKQINISELVNRIYISFETNFKLKNVDFNLVDLDYDCVVRADLDYLKRAISNLVVNALKYTDKGGRVSIELEKAQHYVVISVIDNGIGIAKEDQKKICNQFYQVNNDINRSGGSGIGLSFTKKIIELHGGELQIISEPNKGSQFKIIFPVDDLSVIKTSDYHPLQINKEDHQKIIKRKPIKEECFLIVDDNRKMREYLQLILKDYKCLEAENGLEALELLDENKVDFVITDYMMPKMDGPDFVKALKKKKYAMPILILTARTDKESRLNSFRLGIDDYLNKPFDRDELLIRVENTLSNYLSRVSYIDKEEIGIKEVEETQGWIEEVEQYIFQQCSNLNFKQIDIAEHFNISESSLYRKVKSSRGKTPNQFITELKLQKARKIIENDSEVSLKKVSLEVGFKHYHYFSEIYFKRFGNKPWS